MANISSKCLKKSCRILHLEKSLGDFFLQSVFNTEDPLGLGGFFKEEKLSSEPLRLCLGPCGEEGPSLKNVQTINRTVASSE